MATRGIGTLTLDLLLKVGGFKQGMTEAERSAERAMRKIAEDAKRASQSVNQSFSGGVRTEGLQRAARVVQTELKKTEDAVKAVKASFGDVGFRIPGLAQAEADARKFNAALAMMQERTAALIQSGFGERLAAQVATPLELYRKQVELLTFALNTGVIEQQTYARALNQTTQTFIAGTPAMQQWTAMVERAGKLTAANISPLEQYRQTFKELTQLSIAGLITPEVRTAELEKAKKLRDELTGVTQKQMEVERQQQQLEAQAAAIIRQNMTAQEKYTAELAEANQLKTAGVLVGENFNREEARLTALLNALTPATQAATTAQKANNAALAEAAKLAASVRAPFETYRDRLKEISALRLAAPEVVTPKVASRAGVQALAELENAIPALREWNELVAKGAQMMRAAEGPQGDFIRGFKELSRLAMAGEITPQVRTEELAKLKKVRDDLTGVTAEQNRLDAEAARIKQSLVTPQQEYNQGLALTAKLLETSRIDQTQANAENARLKQILDAANPAEQEKNRLIAEAAKLYQRLQDPLIQYKQRLAEIAAMKIAAPDLVSDEIETAAIKEAEDAYNALNPEIQENIRLEKEAAAIKAANTSAQERYDAAIAHSAALIGKVGFTQADHNREVARQKAILDASNPTLQEHARLMAEGARATQQHMTAQQRLDAAIAHANKLYETYDATLKRTAIDQATHTRMVAAARAEFDRATQSTKRLTGGLIDFGKLVGRGFGLQALAAQALSIYALIRGFQTLIKTADDLALMSNRLSLVTKGTADLKDTQAELFEISQRNRVEFLATADLYVRLAQAGGELGATQAQLMKFTEAVGAALTISGTSAERARGVLIQLSQGMATGTFRAEEFNSVLEGAPQLIRVAAQNIERFGGSVGQLRNAVREGKLQSVEFFDAVLKGADDLEDAIAKMPVTISGAFTQLKNVFAGAVLEADIGPLVTSVQELKDLITDPQFKQDMTSFVELIFKLAGLALQAAAGVGRVFEASITNFKIITGQLSEYQRLQVAIDRRRQTIASESWMEHDLAFIGLTNEQLEKQIEYLEKRQRLIRSGPQRPMADIRQRVTPDEALKPIDESAAKEAENAQKSILKQIQALDQQRAVLNKNAAATMAYRIAQGDLKEEFEKAGPTFDKYKQVLVNAAAALEQATAIQSVNQAIESLQNQAAVLNLTEDAAFEYNLTQGELAKQLEKTGAAQAGLTEEYRKAHAELEKQKDIKTIIEGLVDVQKTLLEASGRTAEAAALDTEERYRKLLEAVSAETERAVAEMAALGSQMEGAVIDPKVDASGIETITIEAKKAKYSLEELQQIEIKIKAAMDIESFRAQAEALDQKIEQIRAEFSRQEQTIQARIDTGLQSEIGAKKELIALHEREAARLQDLYEEYQRLADVSGMEEIRRKMEELGLIIEDLKTSVETLGKVMADAFEEGIGDALGDLAKGVSSLGEAAADFLQSITDALIDWAAEQVAAQLRDIIFGKDGPLGDILKTIEGGGIFGGGGGGGWMAGLEEIAVPKARLPEGLGDVAAAGAETAGTAAALTAAGTAAAASITTASGALTAAGTTAAGALTTAGTTVAGAITTAGTAAAAAIRTASATSASSALPIAAAAAGGARGGLLSDIAVAAGLGIGRYAGGGPLDVFSGGLLRGPGTPTSDSLLLRGSRDEFMVQARAVAQPGGRQFLDAYNNGLVTVREIRHGLESIGRLPRFAGGGSLTGVNPTVVSGTTVPSSGSDDRRPNQTINQYLTVNAAGGNVSRQTEMNLTAAAARGLKLADRHNN